ncbi:MAG: NAD(P)H-hydrate dehydratase, partial [Caldimonas sp.]
MSVVGTCRRFERPLLLTPHAGEMAHLCGTTKDAVLADPERACRDAAARWNAVVALKGALHARAGIALAARRGPL